MGCEQCGKPVGHQGKRFCSTACWYEFTKQRRMSPCEVCGTPFERVPKTQRACSVECGNKLKRVDRDVTCKTCGKTFERPHGKQRLYCSRSCAQTARTKAGEFVRDEGAIQAHMNGYLMEKRGGRWHMQHRLIVSEKLGRPLEPFERVHHINGHRDDNHPENLELWIARGKSKKDPAGQRWSDLMNEFLSQPEVTDRAAIEAAFRRIFKL